MEENRDPGQQSRHRATTRVTLNVPTGDDKRPRTPDTFEREFNTFFRKNSSEIYDNVPPGNSAADNRFYYDPFSNFSTRNNSNFFKEFQESLPGQFRHQRFHDLGPEVGLKPQEIRRTGGYNQTRHDHRTGTLPSQTSPTGSSPGAAGVSATTPRGAQTDRPERQRKSIPLEERVWMPTRQMTSSTGNDGFGGLENRRRSGGQIRLTPTDSKQTSPLYSKNPPDSVTSTRRGSHDVISTSGGTDKWERQGSVSKSELSPGGSQSQQSDEELRTHGPSYTMFKLDDPQMEISEEFPNRERIRKLSEQLNKMMAPPAPHYNLYNPPPIEESPLQESECLSPNPALPDWKANVLIGENFQKRHLAIKRQGTTVHVTAQKTTESVQLGRKQLTREWRVVAPEVVDSQSIQAEFLEEERKLIITGYFDKFHPVEIK